MPRNRFFDAAFRVIAMASDELKRWSSASLSVRSLTMPPDEMEARIGFAPTRAHCLGEEFGTRRRLTRKHHLFRWWPVGLPDQDLGAHLAALCDHIEPFMDRIRSLRHECEVDLFCGYGSVNGQGGTTIMPGLLCRLAALDLNLVLDLYPPTTTLIEIDGSAFNASSETARKS